MRVLAPKEGWGLGKGGASLKATFSFKKGGTMVLEETTWNEACSSLHLKHLLMYPSLPPDCTVGPGLSLQGACLGCTWLQRTDAG